MFKGADLSTLSMYSKIYYIYRVESSIYISTSCIFVHNYSSHTSAVGRGFS